MNGVVIWWISKLICGNLHIYYSMAGDIDILVQPSSAFIGRALNTYLHLTSNIVTRSGKATGYVHP